ncbi:hypothetical protein [Sediminibacter sp. Hel_I_10]|uniref:hypothetical protein n=1 Tax=Sediminibacter sp. Hel_I_10 TaxID=1392490 RepID=UPI00047E613E|nr:hypothetical protein [Sediminibacter sp. Hel_I_10]
MKTEEIIYTETIALNKAKRQLPLAVAEANRMLQTVTGIIGELDKEEKIKLLKKGRSLVMEKLKDKFLFPNATEQFNLQSLGVDLSGLNRIEYRKWSDFDLEVDENGKYIASERQPYFETFIHRVRTENQKKAVDIAQRMIELVSELQNSGLGGNFSLEKSAQIMPRLLRYNYDSKGQLELNIQEICMYIK